MTAQLPTSGLQIRDLSKNFGLPDGKSVRVLTIPELDLAAGDELAVAGPSGSGKTTLFNLVAGLLLPTAGEIRVNGRMINRMSESERDRFRGQTIGYIFQTDNLLPGFTVLENVLLAMSFGNRIPRAEQRPRATALLESVGMGPYLNHRPARLSSGQQQRVAVARALTNWPALILADEPTAHADYESGQQILGLLRAYCAENGASLILASHDRAILDTFEHVLYLRRDDTGARGVEQHGAVHVDVVPG